MAAAATRSSNNSSQSSSKMSSPKDSKRPSVVKSEDPPAASKEDAGDVKPVTTTAAANSSSQPLAPPPKPAQNGPDGADYFNTNHNSSTFSLEPNPFEQSFGNPSSDTPGRSILPPVASITSPSPLPGVTPGWNSLRSGPLSPAMLAGPTGGSDYFGDGFRGFPTPNESSLRTGLTPGGSGSIFPAPSPNSQALFNLQSGGAATPSTLDFHRTAMNAAAASNNKVNGSQNAGTSQAPEQSGAQAIDRDLHGHAQAQSQQPQQQPQQQQQQSQQAQPAQQQRGQQDMFGGHDVSSAANDLLSFASQANGTSRSQQFGPSATSLAVSDSKPLQEANAIQRRNTKGSIGTSISGSGEAGDHSESGHSEEAKSSTRARGSKKNGSVKNGSANRRKAEETPKGSVNKKQKPNDLMMNGDDEDDSDDMDMTSPKMENGEGGNGKKMTDEEKRKNFLERNRVAALKCRQRKKQWLANLQAKVELFSTENDALSAQVTQLREEVVNLKTLLLAHKDCPVSQAQGLGGMAMNSFIGDINHHANPYGMAMGNGMMQIGQPGR